MGGEHMSRESLQAKINCLTDAQVEALDLLLGGVNPTMALADWQREIDRLQYAMQIQSMQSYLCQSACKESLYHQAHPFDPDALQADEKNRKHAIMANLRKAVNIFHRKSKKEAFK
jgi:hypothetical protein